MQVRKLCQL